MLAVILAVTVWVGVSGFLPPNLLCGSLLWGFPDMLLFLLCPGGGRHTVLRTKVSPFPSLI